MNLSKLKQMKDVLKSKEAPKSQDQERQEPGSTWREEDFRGWCTCFEFQTQVRGRPGSQEDKWSGTAKVQLRKGATGEENQVSEVFWAVCLSTISWVPLLCGV